ncbi:guanine-N(7)-methyltransferase [Schizopora paradoxa]|uniref:mRNA cap guanine-N(7) methyltransferase n=1 Tax=Schizopora paradoxa TaxID=27342 RepID=A0A0H2S478_9AGAM|nr:guanine-N(7)-methyltransferase [Schizopora paradoxa]
MPPPPLSASPEPRTVSPPPPKPSVLPYAPRHRRTPADSVLKPISDLELEFYKNCIKNPLQVTNSALGKRRRDMTSKGDLRPSDNSPPKRSRDVEKIADHYNQRPDVGVSQRQLSPIIGLKSFNNWVKSVLIARFAHPVLRSSQDENGRGSGGRGGGTAGRVLDMGCGKGGDLQKWQKAKVREYVGVGTYPVISVYQARGRYITSAAAQPGRQGPRFEASFETLDCYTHMLSEVLEPRMLDPMFDVVSMQFCMHYAFESVQKARVMLENVSRWLRKGGVFVGTIPNDKFLLSHLDNLPPDELSFGNSVYKIRFEERDRRPIFGQRYYFYLRDAVEDVPEYVVHWDNFVQMASEYKLEVQYRSEFHDVYAEHCDHEEYGPLLQRMKVVDAKGESQMDEEQWDAANVYIAFAFKKL